MASTYAAIGAAAPSQAEFAAFANAMSSSYGAPIELVSVDPGSGQPTELADTSITNLLAELPVLETTANGVNLGLQLADGTQIRFASTAGLADFLYATAVQQMQATSFVTDNFNMDIQWLNTVGQPLLNEAVGWNEHAAALRAAGGAIDDQQAIESDTQSSLALQIAAQAPSNRQNITVTIANPVAGNPTQVTVYAGGGGSIHDTTPGIGTYIESVISLGLNIAAAVSGQAYLYFAAAAADAAQSGQAFANGQDLQGLLTLAQAVAAGITADAGGTTPGTLPPVPAQVLNAAAQGVGGLYGVVKSAQTGNAVGMLAAALEAAAAGAAGIGIYNGGQTQNMLNTVSAALGSAGIATNMASDFASGNLRQGLLDSLNLYLPAVAQAFANYQSNQNTLQQPLQMNDGAFAAATALATNLPDYSTAIDQAFVAAVTPSFNGDGQMEVPSQYGFTIDTAAFDVAVADAGANGVPNFNGVISQLSPSGTLPTDGVSEIASEGGAEWKLTFFVDSSGTTGTDSKIDVTAAVTGAIDTINSINGTQSILDTIQATVAAIAGDVMSFLGYANPIGTADAAEPIGQTAIGSNGYVPQAGDVTLLARLMFAEAANTPSEYADIGWTVVDRIGVPGFALTLAGIVNQPGQFSSVGGSLWNAAAVPQNLTGPNASSYQSALNVANSILSGNTPNPTNGATFFYSGSAAPRWFQSELNSGGLLITLRQNGFTYLKQP